MSKFKKVPEKVSKKKKTKSDEVFAYRTIVISAIFSGCFFILSILFNGGIITFFMREELPWDIIDVVIKVVIILLLYFFIMISYGNYKELLGKPIETKEILMIFLLVLVQSSLNLYVFIFSLIGLVLFLFYFYLLQE